jgi:MFS family permease
MLPAIPVVILISLLTFLHYVAAQMRGPVIPLYAAAHGATATGVGFIVAAHMAAAAVGSIPLGRAGDLLGRRPFLLGGMALGAVTSLLLPTVEGELALMAIYGIAGLGVAAFTPSALSLVGEAAAPGRVGHAFAWYATAHYGAIGVGPFLGGLAAQWWGYRVALVASGVGIAVALVVGLAMPMGAAPHAGARSGATFGDIRGNRSVSAGWIVSVSLVELGKFSRFHQEAGWPDAQLFEVEARARALGLVRRNMEGELVVAYPLTESDIRAAYLKSRGA